MYMVGFGIIRLRTTATEFGFSLRRSVGLLGLVIRPSQGRYLTQTQNKHKQTSMPRVGFATTIPGFKRVKTVHALDRAATVIGNI
jgi:hypothetical protein